MSDVRSQPVAIVSYVFLVLTWIAVLLRCVVRIKIVKLFGTDDFLMLAALPVFTMFCVFAILSTYYGTGRHADTLTPDQIRNGLRLWKGGELSYVVSSAVAKLSVGFFLLRVTVSKVHRRILHVAMIVTAVCGVVFFFILLLQCIPVSYFWDQITGSEKGHCMPNLLVMGGSFAYMTAGGTCDFIFGLLPIWIVWPLKTGYWVKVELVLILGLGALAGTATVIRMPYIRNFDSMNDFLWITRYIVFWSLIEVGLGMTAGSLATLRPLYRRLFMKTQSQEEEAAVSPKATPPNNGNGKEKRPGWTTWQMDVTARERRTSLDVELVGSNPASSRLDVRDKELVIVKAVSIDEDNTRESMDSMHQQPTRVHERIS